MMNEEEEEWEEMKLLDSGEDEAKVFKQ